MRKFLPFMLLMLSVNSFAQFKTVYPERTSFYKTRTVSYAEWEYFPVKIENKNVINEDTLYNTFNVLGYYNDRCGLSIKGFPWIGKKIIMTNDHKEIFVNKREDSITFFKNVNLNDSWIFNKIGDSHFEATVVKKETETFSLYKDQVTDSVLTISLNLKDNENDVLINHKFNGKQWKISKTYGFIKAYNLLHFPEDTNALILDGVEELNLGVKNLTEKDFFNFEIGDVFHIMEYVNGPPSELEPPFVNTNKMVRMEVIDKSLNSGSDSIIYTIAVVENEGIYSTKILVKEDTIYQKVALYPSLSGINEIPTKIMMKTCTGQYLYKDPLVWVKTIKTMNYYEFTSDSCYFMPVRMAPGLSEDYEYWTGLGGPYYSFEHSGEGLMGSSYVRELIYYKKGNKEHGQPYNFVMNILPNDTKISLNVSPNPTTHHVTISGEGIKNSNYKIYNIEGKEMMDGIFNGEEENIDVKNLSVGIYSLLIMKEGRVAYTSRFVKN